MYSLFAKQYIKLSFSEFARRRLHNSTLARNSQLYLSGPLRFRGSFSFFHSLSHSKLYFKTKCPIRDSNLSRKFIAPSVFLRLRVFLGMPSSFLLLGCTFGVNDTVAIRGVQGFPNHLAGICSVETSQRRYFVSTSL